ncbi:MAG: BLUF domain-containing protein [Cellvibrionaceae bacterium]
MADSFMHLGYMSKAVDLMSDAQLDHLLEKARPRNEKKSITGMLLYADGSFLQVIEGPSTAVADTFTRIRKDSQHHQIKVLFEETIKNRNFESWTMGFRRLSTDEVGTAPGMNYFLQGNENLHDYLLSHNNSGKMLQNIFLFFKRAA